MPTALDNPWKFVLTSTDGQTIYGELTNARERTVSDPHMGTPSLSCTIRIDHPLAGTVLNEECLIKAYRGSALIFHGPVVTVEEVGESNGQSVRITAAGAWWRASKRIIKQSTHEAGLGISPSTHLSNAMGFILNFGNGYYFPSGIPGTSETDVTLWTGIEWNETGG
jgi:hypothetical protein